MGLQYLMKIVKEVVGDVARTFCDARVVAKKQRDALWQRNSCRKSAYLSKGDLLLSFLQNIYRMFGIFLHKI